MNITYKVRRGKRAGEIFTPHKHANGKYVVSKTRFKADYIYLDALQDVVEFLDKGYRVRMSSPSEKREPSLICRKSIEIKP